MKKKNLMLVTSICSLILSMVIASIPITYQNPAWTKLRMVPSSIIGPPPGIGQTFTMDIYLENVTELSAWQIGLKWDPMVLNCTGFTVATGAGTFLGPVGDWLYFDGVVNNSTGGVCPPYVYSLKAGETPRTGTGSMAEVGFLVIDYGFTRIEFNETIIKTGVDKIPIPVDMINCTFALLPTSPAAPVADFTYSPPAPQANQTVTFDASTSVPGFNGTGDVPIANYTWDFGDGNNGTGMIVNHNYTAAGNYPVNLTVTCEYDPVLAALGYLSDSIQQVITVTGPVHDVAVTSVTPFPTEVTTGEFVHINVTVKNEGTFTETFDVTAYYDNTEIKTKSVNNLPAGNETTLTFTWNTTGLAGEYTIKAVAEQVAGEIDPTDNTLIDGTVTVTKTKLYIVPASIIGPPPGIGENFTVDIYLENVINLTGWQMGLKWDPAVLNCTSWTTLFNTAVMGPRADWLGVVGTINNIIGEVYPGYAYSLKREAWGREKSGSDALVKVNFTVLDYGFTWIGLTYVSIRTGHWPPKPVIPVDITNGSFTLLPPEAPWAIFAYLPSAPQVNQRVTFDASASMPGFNGTGDVPIANYTWDFGDGNVTTVTDPIIYHTYAAAGTYTVNLTVMCEYDPILTAMDLTSDSYWQNITITEIPVVLVHDVAVTSVTPSPTEVTEGESVTVTVNVKNEGDFPETFTVTVYYDTTQIGTQTVTGLASGAIKTLTFNWDTTDVKEDEYTIKAVASTVTGETDTTDNTRTADDKVTVKAPAPEIPWLWIILAIIVIVVIVIAIIAYMALRKRKTK